MHRLAFLTVLLAVCSLGHCWGISASGEACSVRRPEKCGEPEIMGDVTVEPATGFGPNVCVYEKTEAVATFDYVTERICRSYFGFNICRSQCVRTDNCTERNVTTSWNDCCSGFAARSAGRDHGYGYGRVNRHPSYYILMTEGCPIELKDTVVDCLQELNLTEFVSRIEETGLSTTLRDMEGEFTVFAPTNTALAGATLDEPSLNAHVLDEIVRNSALRSGSVLTPLREDTLLHVTDVQTFYWWRSSEETFINGAQVENSDACLAENGVVHVMNSVIPSSAVGIAGVLASDPQFSTFKSLLDATNFTQYLEDNVNCSRTVFAPTNDAFDLLPEGAVQCLLEPENLWKAKKLVLNHIAYPTEYTSSLSQRNVILTLSYRLLLVCVINDTIHLTREAVPLQETDITARNGVIHSVPQVLLAHKIDFERLCPDPTPEPTSDPTLDPTPDPVPPIPPVPELPQPGPEVPEDPGVIVDPAPSPNPDLPEDDIA